MLYNAFDKGMIDPFHKGPFLEVHTKWKTLDKYLIAMTLMQDNMTDCYRNNGIINIVTCFQLGI